MKRLFSLIVSLVAVFYATHAHTAPGQEESKQQRIYLKPEQLQLCKEGIFVCCDQEWRKTDALFSDDRGIYILSHFPQEDGCRKGYVPCRNCDRCVKYYYDICPYCGKPV